ncbi:hypothetical protein ON010_g18328 [Phytophthora cinnamomi]|nr:hypothetical protein ON010_g18328 [Phytophthora cinnamomi]
MQGDVQDGRQYDVLLLHLGEVLAEAARGGRRAGAGLGPRVPHHDPRRHRRRAPEERADPAALHRHAGHVVGRRQLRVPRPDRARGCT